ncbi:acylhydrolase [Spirochaetes bacterium]|uniref:Acylhydrolase n=1 Tax=Candidatus Scatousia excrementipullorum TaxID=2840936 RepID=A0A9D9DPU8_9BACT|nr:acylhydrolase [Candidatus Scatousia excrementipullorum]
MKKILCFGDSNTYGFIPSSGKRYDENSRWSGILKKLLREEYEIIEAGCNNRTAFCDNPAGVNETGYKVLPSLLTPDIDCVILAVGINDLQYLYNISMKDYESGLENLIGLVRTKLPRAKIILLSPSVITEDILNSYFAAMFDETSIEKSKQLSAIYERAARKENCKLLDLKKIASPSKTDGLHYEKIEHIKIANAIFDLINHKG